MTTVWTVKGGLHGEREDLMLTEGLIGGGWEALGSLEDISSKEELTEIYRSAYPDSSERRTSAHIAQLWSLLSRMQVGDVVVLPVKTTGTIAVGRVSGPYQYREDLREDTKHVRSVEWLATDVPRDEFDQDLLYSFGALLTIGTISREEADTRVLTVIERHQRAPTVDTASASHGAVVDSANETEQPPDVAATAREQVRQLISRTFVGQTSHGWSARSSKRRASKSPQAQQGRTAAWTSWRAPAPGMIARMDDTPADLEMRCGWLTLALPDGDFTLAAQLLTGN